MTKSSSSQSGSNEVKKEPILGTPLLHSPTVTPPIPAGKTLRLVKEGSLDDIETLEADKGYDGIYTGTIADCMAVTVVERDDKGKIIRLSMVHFSGGLNQTKFDALMIALQERETRNSIPVDSREIIITGGNTNQDMDDFKQRLKLYMGNNDIDEYLKQQYRNLRFNNCKYTLVPQVIGSACVTFDGYAGPFYEYQYALTEKQKDYTTDQKSFEIEKKEFEKLKLDKRFDPAAVDRVKSAIENSSYNDQVKAQLYFYTREFIFKTRFNSDLQLIQDPSAYAQHRVVRQALEDYKKQINGLPMITNKELIISAVFSLVTCGVGVIFAVGYLGSVVMQRSKTLNELQKEPPLQQTNPKPSKK